MAELNRPAAEAMVAARAQAATDVTGFGLAGHAMGMARASGVRLRVSLGSLPVYDGVEALVTAGVSTRGTRANRDTFAGDVARTAPEGPRADLVYDPQTAGGLLIAVDAGRAAALVDDLRQRGAGAAAVIGEVLDGPAGLELVP
jgi:selenide,water dikinase